MAIEVKAMCYAGGCNPKCGKCQPRRIIEVNCPQCGGTNDWRREEYLLYFNLPHRKSIIEEKMLEKGPILAPHCKHCGADLTETFKNEIQPTPCHLTGIICGFPCGRKDEEPREGAQPCKTMVPLGKLEE